VNISLKVRISEEYYKEFYSEWLKFRSYKKWQPHVAILLLIFGIVLFIVFRNNFFIPILFILFGIYEFFEFYYSRNKWLKERLSSNITNKEIMIIFEDNIIKSNGPFSNNELKWNGISKAIETEKGLFLIPENGVSIYLQKSSFDSIDQVQSIITKVQNSK